MVESELVLQRNKELVAAFFRLLGDGRLAKDVMSSAASMPCSRFWTTPDNAFRYVRLRLLGKWGDTGKEHKMQVKKIDDIIRLCDGDYSIENVTRVVESPAPCFYLEGCSAVNIIYNTLKERKRK